MIDHFRSDLFDDVVERQLKTIDLLVDKEKPLGPIHRYLMESTFKNVRSDVSQLNVILKIFNKVLKIKRKFRYKLDKKSKNIRRCSKLKSKYDKKVLKYKFFLPAEAFNLANVIDNVGVKPVKVSEVITEIEEKRGNVKLEVSAQDSAEEKLNKEKKEKDEKPEIPPGQIAMELDKFFNSSAKATAQEEQ